MRPAHPTSSRRCGCAKRAQTATLVARELLSADLLRLTFSVPAPIESRAGQFAMVRGVDWEQSPLLPRPMSLLEGGSRPMMLVRRVGRGTGRLADAPIGDAFGLLAPLGRPWDPCERGEQPVLVAGGVGLPPLLYRAREMSQAANSSPGEQPGGRPATMRPIVLYGGRTAADIVLTDSLAAVGQLRVATEDGTLGQRGRVTDLLTAVLDELARGGRQAHVLACGPHPMMAAVAEIARSAGCRCQVSLEARMACGYGVCLGCAMPRATGGYLYVCSDGPCVEASAVDWTVAP